MGTDMSISCHCPARVRKKPFLLTGISSFLERCETLVMALNPFP